MGSQTSSIVTALNGFKAPARYLFPILIWKPPESWAQAYHHDADIVGTELLQGMVQKDLTGLGGTHHILDQIHRFLVTADIPQLDGHIGREHIIS